MLLLRSTVDDDCVHGPPAVVVERSCVTMPFIWTVTMGKPATANSDTTLPSPTEAAVASTVGACHDSPVADVAAQNFTCPVDGT
jgi:hypothetical protein